MSHTEVEHKPFSKIRNLIWPIHSFELKKLLPMFVMFFLIAFVYNLLHCLKVPLVVKAPGSGSEIIPFLQIVAILPVAFFLTWIYTKLLSRFSREHVFYMVVLGFLSYFVLFTFVLYPQRELLQLDTIADFLQQRVFTGIGAKGFIAAIRHFNLAMFYVLAEMWSVMVLFMLFWGFANEVTNVHEAKRFYAIFAMGANCSGIISGQFAKLIDNINFIPVYSAYKGSEWLFLQLGFILVLSVVILGLFWWLNHRVFRESHAHLTAETPTTEQTSLLECLSYLVKSRYVMYMLLMVVGYYVVYNLSEIMWAYKLELIMETGKEINVYMNQVYTITGIVSVLLAILVSGNVIRKFGWTIAALVTPMIWLLTSVGFFAGMTFEGTVIFDVIGNIITNPANLVLLIGSAQICLGRGCKYTVFDGTKEIAFIPLSKDEQRKAKVIVDGLGSRFGKSGGSVIYVVLFYLCGEMANVIPYVGILIFVALAAWIYATLKMGKIISHATETGHAVTLMQKPQAKDTPIIAGAKA
ncbi:MAG TPA: Npt1/Npt2 family nucleotide transporter [Gammaproteobacteria bacterium]|nr:Npt1/Npt2 family nucleotide transporter [Gammaproteobacteria bacterium]